MMQTMQEITFCCDKQDFEVNITILNLFFCFVLQFWIAMHYLSIMTEDQTMVLYSGHPMGLFPTSPHAPRVAVTSGCLKVSLLS